MKYQGIYELRSLEKRKTKKGNEIVILHFEDNNSFPQEIYCIADTFEDIAKTTKFEKGKKYLVGCSSTGLSFLDRATEYTEK